MTSQPKERKPYKKRKPDARNDVLLDREQLFVAEYLIDFHANEAGLRAGYKNKIYGNQLMLKPKIRAAIASKIEERNKVTGIDAAWVLKKAAELTQRCMQEVKPKMVKVGKEWVHDQDADGNLLFVFNAAGAAKGLELVGKHIDVGAFKDRLEVDATMTHRNGHIDDDTAMKTIQDLKGKID